MRPKSSRAAAPGAARRAAAGPDSAYDAALRLLARRSHSRAELRRKLARRGYDASEIDGVIVRLERRRYLDDAEFAAGHVRRRSASRGPLALAAELAARGVERHIADGAVAAVDRTAQLAAATRLAERLSGGVKPAGYKELLDSVGAKLVRRGFAPAVAREACRAVWPGTAGRLEP